MSQTPKRRSRLTAYTSKSFGYISILLAAMLFAAGPAVAQDKGEDSSESGQAALSERVNLGGFGSIELQEGFLAFKTQNWVDAWYGYIRSADGKFRVEYWIGMVQSPFETQSEGMELMDSTSFPSPVRKAGRRWETKGRTLFAAVPGAYFSAHILNDEQEKLFFQILATYELMRCKQCRSAMSSTADKLDKDEKP